DRGMAVLDLGTMEQRALPLVGGLERSGAVHPRLRLGCQHQRKGGPRLQTDAEGARGVQVGTVVETARGLLAMMEIPVPDAAGHELTGVSAQPEGSCAREGVDNGPVRLCFNLGPPALAAR